MTPPPQTALSSVDPRSSDPLSFLQTLISIPSLTGEETEAADFVESHVQAAGLDVLRKEDNVSFALGDGEDVLLLNSHLDVVPPSAHHPYDPFDPVVEDGVLYGRGSVDAKASGATMTTALLSLLADGWSPPNGGQVRVALTTYEEAGGVKNGLDDFRPYLPDITAALVGEPTDMQPCVAQKGLLILKIHAHGTAAHAARAHLGDNAITRAMHALQCVHDVSLDRTDPHLGPSTVNVTTIRGGDARNAIPDHCVFAVDIRTTPAYTHQEIIDQVRDALASLDGIEVEVYSNRFVPCATPESARILDACADALTDAAPFGSPTCSDWCVIHDVPAIKIGPGDSNRSHTAGECIPVTALHDAVAGYRSIIQAYFRDR